MKTLTIEIAGMSCGGCVNSVRNALAGVPGVTIDSVTVGAAAVTYDPGLTNFEEIRAAIAKAGYEVAAA